jgi:hypothetical protein
MLGCGLSANGQRYFIVPNDSLIVNAPFNELSHFTIQQQNNTFGQLFLHWERISLNVPSTFVITDIVMQIVRYMV